MFWLAGLALGGVAAIVWRLFQRVALMAPIMFCFLSNLCRLLVAQNLHPLASEINRKCAAYIIVIAERHEAKA